MEFFPPETFLWVTTNLMLNIARGHSEARRNLCFRSCFGTSADTRADLWFLCYSSSHPITLPVHTLWVLMFMKQHATEENNAGRAGVHEDTFCDWTWCVISVISNVPYLSLKFSPHVLINIFCRLI